MINFHRLKPVLLKIACRAQIRKQILFASFCCVLGQALDRDHAAASSSSPGLRRGATPSSDPQARAIVFVFARARDF